ncbi:MAG: nucleotide sugar dehydrogenase [Candidatus Altiarchaeales archaeon]|nr:MAG: nucleotide sugar dehydrogenase [Candidatus Altiarchaeales archaeon]RLI94441.1 MAG: nucleotide sugar dehydrogenase [Candidatus Altiarchaeales archaeon]HDO81982.1 nucleotide sugar dehydrogenase [Candidatus Altiarchaeales archaeon]HEX54631.1 nucleotide sugar dehydrogenase [Candidatus Altiarchaeales archaeon]
MKPYGLKKEEVSGLLVEGKFTIAVYGLGKMGLPLAAIFADNGANVIGADVNENVVRGINGGINHIREEPGLDELVERNVKRKRLRATTNLKECAKKSDFHIIIVPTLIKDNKPDLSIVNSVSEEISYGLEKGDIVITECTMPPGSTEDLIPILEKSGLKVGRDFGLGHCPERTMTGTAIRDITGRYPKIVGAIDEKTREALEGIYSVINSKGVISVSDIKTAESVKVFEGIYRDVNIALANELTTVCEKLGIDAMETFKTANTQPYCNIHTPGGVGGHCIPFYPYFVMDEDTKLIRTAREINDSIPEKIVNMAEDALKEKGIEIKNSEILVLGITFRGNVKEIIKSPSIEIIHILKLRGANVHVYDPLFEKNEIKSLGFDYSRNFSNIDCLIIATDHEEFKTYNWREIYKEMRNKILVDARQVVNPEEMRRLGFAYRGLGHV